MESEKLMSTLKFDQNRVTEVLDITLLNNFIRKIYLFTKIPITLLELKGDVIVASEWTTRCGSIFEIKQQQFNALYFRGEPCL